MAEIDVFKKQNRGNSPPIPMFVNIGLSSYGSDDGTVLLSPDLGTDTEVDESVDFLIKQLENARRKAKNILRNK